MSFGYRVLGFGQSEISLFPQENFSLSAETLIDGNNNLDVFGFDLDRHNRGKGAICWRDGGNIRIKVFTSSTGNAITLGSTQTIALGANFRNDADNLAYIGSDKFVIGYIKNGDSQNNSTNPCVRICTVSGTTVSVGSETVVRGSYSNGMITCGDEEVDDRLCVMYTTYHNSAYRVMVQAATVSGTTPSFGSMTELTSDNGNAHSQSYRNGRLMIAYKDHYGANFSTVVRACSVSGSSITLGSQTSYDSTQHAKNGYVRVNPNNTNEAIVANQNKSNNKPQLKIATLSSNSVSFGSFITVDDKNVETHKVRWNKLFEDKIVSIYTDEDATASDPGRAKFKVGTIDGSSINYGDEISLLGSNAGAQLFEFDAHADGADKFFYIYKTDSDNYSAIRIGQMGGRS
jgi:hypothetical protein